jgi:hypothetical protein
MRVVTSARREDTAGDKARQQQAEALKKYKQEVEKLTAQTESDRTLLQVPNARFLEPFLCLFLWGIRGAFMCRLCALNAAAAGAYQAKRASGKRRKRNNRARVADEKSHSRQGHLNCLVALPMFLATYEIILNMRNMARFVFITVTQKAELEALEQQRGGVDRESAMLAEEVRSRIKTELCF